MLSISYLDAMLETVELQETRQSVMSDIDRTLLELIELDG
jgi:hypothetical protein